MFFLHEVPQSRHVRLLLDDENEQFQFSGGALEGVAFIFAVIYVDLPPLLRLFDGFRRSCLHCCRLLPMVLWYLEAVCRGIGINGRRQVRPQMSIVEPCSCRCMSNCDTYAFRVCNSCDIMTIDSVVASMGFSLLVILSFCHLSRWNCICRICSHLARFFSMFVMYVGLLGWLL